MRVFSFSIKPLDTKGLKVVDTIKEHCSERGISFSYIVVVALTKYLDEVING